MQRRELLLKILSDGRFHSGQRLAEVMGLSRAAIWKQLKQLEVETGLTINAVRGRGYRLVAPLELLDAARVRAEIGPPSTALLDALHVLSSTDSTNNRAAADLPGNSGRARVWLAEHQTSGRGRRGRTWVSGYGNNLNLSLAWRFDLPMPELGGLSLVAGVVLAEVLQRLGLADHTLKWPNDVLVNGRKLAGILVEVSGEAGGPTTAVIGVGVNFRMAAAHADSIDQPWTDLAQSSRVTVSRNCMAGMLTDSLIQACHQFSLERLDPFLRRWERFDKLRGQSVAVVRGDQAIEGIYCGISRSGAMLLENESGPSEHHAGEVSLREADRR